MLPVYVRHAKARIVPTERGLNFVEKVYPRFVPTGRFSYPAYPGKYGDDEVVRF